MKVYAFGEPDAPAIVLLPGTCCDWKGNFETVISLLKERYRVLCVSYDGFDRNEATEFPTMLEETEKIEDYIKRNCAAISARLTAVRWADRLSACWRRDRKSGWITAFSAVRIWIRRRRLLPGCKPICSCRCFIRWFGMGSLSCAFCKKRWSGRCAKRENMPRRS